MAFLYERMHCAGLQSHPQPIRVTNTQRVTKTHHLPVHVQMAGMLQSSTGSHEENAGGVIDLFQSGEWENTVCHPQWEGHLCFSLE